MSVSLADITEDMIAEDQVRFPRVFSLSRRDKVIRTLVLGGGMLILLYGLNRFGFFGEKFWGSLGKMVVMFGQMFPPTGWEHINEYTYAIGELCMPLSLIHISEPTRPRLNAYAGFC